MSKVKFYDKEQLDLVEAQALADHSEDNAFDLVRALLFSGDYRIEGGNISEDSPVSGVIKIDPAVFVKADGKFYSMATIATANILTGVEDQPANVWGTGLAADPTNPRKDIIVVDFQRVESNSSLKDFVDDTVDPPLFFTQTVNTRLDPAPIFSVVHGTPSATPSEPPTPSGTLKLATVDIAASQVTISDGDITNNLNINLKTLEKLQLASQAASAFSDLLHSDGIYAGVNSEMEVVETGPASSAVSVSTGVALKDGVTANVNTQTTVPIDAASFVNNAAEVVSFAGGDLQPLLTDGSPPHKIRAATFLVTGLGGAPTYVDGPDYAIDLVLATITRNPGGAIPGGGSVEVTYDYFLPRIDLIEILMSNSTPQAIAGVPAHAPVAPAQSPNTTLLSEVTVGEDVSVILNADITDKRIFLPDMDEIINARNSDESGAHLTLDTRLEAHEVRAITVGQAVHGIQQGSGNGFDADTVDGNEGTFLLARANHTGTQSPTTISPQGSGSGLDADTVDGNEGTFLLARANHTGTQAPATINPQGSGSTLDADLVDGIHAAVSPEANKLVPLDGDSKFPLSTIPGAFSPGNSLKSSLIVTTGSNLLQEVDIDIELLSVEGIILTGIDLTVDIVVSGANGLDDGSEASSTWYAIHVITNDDGSSVAGILSVSPTSPTLPVAFTKFRRIGWVRNNGSSNFVEFYQKDHTVMLPVNVGVASPSGLTSFADFVPPGTRYGFMHASVQKTTSAAGTRCTNVGTPGGSLITRTCVSNEAGSGGSNAGNFIAFFDSSRQLNISSSSEGAYDTNVEGYKDEV